MSYNQADLLRDRKRDIQHIISQMYAQRMLGMRLEGIQQVMAGLSGAAQAYDQRAVELGLKPLKNVIRSSDYSRKRDSTKLLLPSKERAAYAIIVKAWFKAIDHVVKHDQDLFQVGGEAFDQWHRAITASWTALYDIKKELTQEVGG